MSDLVSDLLKVSTAPPVQRTQGAPLTSSLEVRGDVAEATINTALAPRVELEGRARDLLHEYDLDPADWEVTSFRSSKWTMANGEEGVSARFSFGRTTAGANGAPGVVLPDLDDLHQAVQRIGIRPIAQGGGAETLVGVIADPQVGKVDHRGGVEELLQRLERSLEGFKELARRSRPNEIILVDAGDAIENFESTASEERTNDLQLTEQIRVWRRVFWSWIDAASQMAPKVTVLSVGSNHCRVRRGKNNLGTPSDDYGIEVLMQVADMASVNAALYGHVEFFAPDRHSESVAIETLGGKVLGVAHGHQVNGADRLGQWLAGQALGRTPIGGADVVVFGHWHNLRIQTVGNDRWLFIAPTSDNGSSWFRNISGAESAPGVLAFILDEGGWRDLTIV